MLELLYRESWGTEDGLGAVILTPTRELALQIFDVIRIIGKKHQLSAGLVTGGKKEFAEEQARVGLMNILVATPGRLLQVTLRIAWAIIAATIVLNPIVTAHGADPRVRYIAAADAHP